MNNNVLGAIIPSSKGRKIAYALYSLAAFVVGNTAVYIAATTGEAPSWLIGATAVINNIAPIFGAVAIANVKPSEKPEEKVTGKPVEMLPAAPQPSPESIAHEKAPEA